MQIRQNYQRIEYYNHILQKKAIYKKVIENLAEEERESLYNVVLMPVLIEFIDWVLTESIKSGKQRLYFLARDGYQMYLVAQRLCQIKNLPIECRYLKVSRYAMRMPEYHLLKEKCVDYICIGGIDVTVERIMNRAGLPKERAKEYLPEQDGKRILNYSEIMEMKEELRQKQEFLEEIYAQSKKTYEPAIAYLKQEGLFDNVNYALVDSGWIGTLQKTIAHLVDRPYLEGYYFGLYETPKDVSSEQYHSYHFGPKWGLKRKVHFSNCLFEAIFTSPEGMTLYYKKQGESYVPVADMAENPNKVQILENCRQLEKYMDIYETLYPSIQSSKEVGSGMVDALLHEFMGNPTSQEVEQYGNLLFSDDVLEGNLKKVAADLSVEEIRQQRFVNKALIMLGMKKGEIHESAWIEGSIVKAGKHVLSNLFHAKLYKYFVYIRKMWK